MRTKIVYCLVSDASDYYYEQLLISVYSLRKHNPDVIVEVVVDDTTNATLVNSRSRVRQYVNSIIQVEVPEQLTKKQRSRFIKTKLRKLVSGDYLYIDTDTIIRSSLAELDNITSEICATQEYNELNHFTKTDYSMNFYAVKVDLADELENEPYFNSGLMYAKDSPKAHLLYEQWHSSWQVTMSRGIDTDQTSLCWANKKAGHVIEHLDDSWNCLIKLKGIDFEDKAKIIHYACEHPNTHYILSIHSIFDTIKVTGNLIPIIDDLIDNPGIFFIHASEEKFLRETALIQAVFKHYYSMFCFLRWQSSKYLKCRSILGKIKMKILGLRNV